MSVWSEFQPLKSCVIGTLTPAEKILPHINLVNRYKRYFKEIIRIGIQELDNLENVLKSYDVKTFRSIQHYPDNTGKIINTPPLGIRDLFTIYGDNLFVGNTAFIWNKDVPYSCNHVFNNYSSTYELPHHDIFADQFQTFEPNKMERPLFSTAFVLRCGQDVFISKDMSKDGNDEGRKIFIEWLKSINKNINIHNVDVSGHLDGYIFLVRPGLLMTWLAPSKLPEYFKNWDKVYIDNDTNRVLSHLGQHRHKRYHPVIAQEFYNFLQTNTEETFYNINSLSINENTVLFTGKHKRLFNQLEKHGVDCVSVDLRATTFWDNGLHCVTNELEREGQLEDYATLT